MNQIFDEIVTRPLGAALSAIEMFGQGVEGLQGVDGMLSRLAHTLSNPSPGTCCGALENAASQKDARKNQPTAGLTANQVNGAQFTEADHDVIERVEGALADGRALKQWWDRTYPDGFSQRFELERVFNRPDTSFGFFDRVQLNRGVVPVMGNFQDMFYDQTRTPTNMGRAAAVWMRDQIREFVLHYFMRVSSFRQPEVYVESRPRPLPSSLESLSWCNQPDILRQGFGFTQHYYKLRDTGQIGKFPTQEESAIIDLREIGQKYEWIVVKVRIFAFNFRFKLFGPNGLEVSIPLAEESYLVLSPEFILNEDEPSPDFLGRYGFGYAFIQDPAQGLIGYGPGQFSAAIELMNFEVSPQGKINVGMVFVVNRPERIANLSLNPVDWSFRLADFFSFGMTSRLFAPIRRTLERIPPAVDSFDPVYGFVSLVNVLSANQAAQQLCISREQLEKEFLAQHFAQHYVTVEGSLLTWRQIPNWLDSMALPEWVVTGRSS